MERGTTKSLSESLRSYGMMRRLGESHRTSQRTRVSITKHDVLRLYTDCAKLMGHRSSDREFHKTLIGLSKASDYGEGREVVISHSNNFLSERCGMAKTTFTDQLRKHDGKTIRRRLGGNGHRYTMRRKTNEHDGEIIYHNAISLEPMIERLLEMVPMLQAECERKDAIAIAKARAGAAVRRQRSAIMAIGESQSGLALQKASKELTKPFQEACKRQDVAEAERLVRKMTETADMIEQLVTTENVENDEKPIAEVSETRHDLPIQTIKDWESVVLGETVKKESSAEETPTPQGQEQWKSREIVDLFPTLAMFVDKDSHSDWRSVTSAANHLAVILRINPASWDEAASAMGSQGRIVALGLIAEMESQGRITTSPGHYFGGMMRKARLGQLDLGKSVWRVRKETKISAGGQRDQCEINNAKPNR